MANHVPFGHYCSISIRGQRYLCFLQDSLFSSKKSFFQDRSPDFGNVLPMVIFINAGAWLSEQNYPSEGPPRGARPSPQGALADSSVPTPSIIPDTTLWDFSSNKINYTIQCSFQWEDFAGCLLTSEG